jgi:hypothetical protein
VPDRGRTLAALLGLVAGVAAAADDGAATRDPVAPFTARYEVLRDGSPLGVATFTLRELDAQRRELTTHTRGTAGLAALTAAEIVERSEFRWRAARPELVRYRYEQQVAWKRKRRALDVDATATTIASHDGKRDHVLAFEPGVMDRHAVVVALIAALAHPAPAAAGTDADADFDTDAPTDAGAGAGPDQLAFRVADKDAIETQRYRREGPETVEVPAGRYAAERIARIRENPGRVTTTWFAAQLGYLPVRIVQKEPDGETVEMRLIEWSNRDE